jgi:hypothetical protein
MDEVANMVLTRLGGCRFIAMISPKRGAGRSLADELLILRLVVEAVAEAQGKEGPLR